MTVHDSWLDTGPCSAGWFCGGGEQLGSNPTTGTDHEQKLISDSAALLFQRFDVVLSCLRLSAGQRTLETIQKE